jgi:menaquinol-cytochrome c reductase iron-sulfur subunit
MAESQDTRRGFFAKAAMAIGGLVGVAVALPVLRYVFFPVRRRVVSDSGAPIDALDAKVLEAGAAPRLVQLKATQVRDGWAVSDEVSLGAAWVRKTANGEVEALSSTCPHLGCAVDFDAQSNEFRCPCHKSAFTLDGAKISGPSKRGLDPLPVAVEDDRVKITFVRYRADVAEREPV